MELFNGAFESVLTWCIHIMAWLLVGLDIMLFFVEFYLKHSKH